MNVKKSTFIWLPLLILLVLTPWSAPLDLKVSHFFYQQGHFQANAYLDFIYHYGTWPGWFLVGSACLILSISCFYSKWKKYQTSALYLILTLAIGAGLIIHVCLKDQWGRPRPKQTIEFGGTQSFRPYYSPHFLDQPEPSKSFPCGHCSMGFYFFSLILLGKHARNRFIYYLGITATISLGVLLSLTRIAQGGHFFSDVIVSALIMWWTSYGLYYLFFHFTFSTKYQLVK